MVTVFQRLLCSLMLISEISIANEVFGFSFEEKHIDIFVHTRSLESLETQNMFIIEDAVKLPDSVLRWLEERRCRAPNILSWLGADDSRLSCSLIIKRTTGRIQHAIGFNRFRIFRDLSGTSELVDEIDSATRMADSLMGALLSRQGVNQRAGAGIIPLIVPLVFFDPAFYAVDIELKHTETIYVDNGLVVTWSGLLNWRDELNTASLSCSLPISEPPDTSSVDGKYSLTIQATYLNDTGLKVVRVLFEELKQPYPGTNAADIIERKHLLTIEFKQIENHCQEEVERIDADVEKLERTMPIKSALP